MAECAKDIIITTSYSIQIKGQLPAPPSGEQDIQARGTSGHLIALTSRTCLAALSFITDAVLKEWNCLETLPAAPKKGVTGRWTAADHMIHSTSKNTARYSEFDDLFPNMPSYTRRSLVAKAIGIVSSYISNHRNWEAADPAIRGAEPVLGLPDRLCLTFYKQDRDTSMLERGIIGLKLFNGKAWGWHYFTVGRSDAKRISSLCENRKMLSPVLEKQRGKYMIRFSFEEKRPLVQKERPLDYRVLAVDLGINAPASWCVMGKDGSVSGTGVIHLPGDEGRLAYAMHRKRMYQQAGKKSKCAYRWLVQANRQLAIDTMRKIMDMADRFHVNCIVFEHLDTSGKKRGRLKERLHMWRAKDVQARVETQAHRRGIRISRVCAWGTSRYAFDGSGTTDRHSVYTWKGGHRKYNYSVCRFRNGKIYNCDISAAKNIGARFFLREYAKLPGCPALPAVPKRTLATLRALPGEMMAA